MLECKTYLAAWLVLSILHSVPYPAFAAQPDRSSPARAATTLLRQKCGECHAGSGPLQGGIDVLDRESLIRRGVLRPGDLKSRLLTVVETGAMPLKGSRLSPAELDVLRRWVSAGAPRDEPSVTPTEPAFVTEEDLQSSIEEDLRQAAERDRPYQRYFSLVHLLNAGEAESALSECRKGLSFLLNSLSWQRTLALPEAIDRRGLVLRIDLRDLRWTSREWTFVEKAYPYAIPAPTLQRTQALAGTTTPCVRADWFVTQASVPPLYHQLLALPDSVADLEKLLQVEVARHLSEGRNVVRSGLRTSGVSRNNRVLERHNSAFGAYWRTYDFSSSQGAQNIFRNPLAFTPAGGEMIFSLPNGLQGYFLANAKGKRLEVAPIEIVSDRNQPEAPVIVNGRSCMNCHYTGIKPFQDELRPFLEAHAVTDFDRDLALALHPEQAVLERMIAEDQSRFQEARRRVMGDAHPDARTEPVGQVVRRYSNDVTLARASAEVGLPLSEFQKRVGRSRRLISLGFGQLFVIPGALKRDVFEEHFVRLVEDLRPDQYRNPGVLDASGRKRPARVEEEFEIRR